MSDIQQARDVLAKWRRWMSPDPWTISGATVKDTSGTAIADYEGVQNLVARHAALQNVRLIVGTAGNPALLDAIDKVLVQGLEDAQYVYPDHPSMTLANSIAAAILSAEERMSA